MVVANCGVEERQAKITQESMKAQIVESVQKQFRTRFLQAASRPKKNWELTWSVLFVSPWWTTCSLSVSSRLRFNIQQMRQESANEHDVLFSDVRLRWKRKAKVSDKQQLKQLTRTCTPSSKTKSAKGYSSNCCGTNRSSLDSDSSCNLYNHGRTK